MVDVGGKIGGEVGKHLTRIFVHDRLPGEGPSRHCILAGRAFFLMAALLLAIMPWTAWFWSFDNFLHGGQDFELGLLAVLSIFCLLIVLLQRRRAELTIALALDRWLTSLFANTRHAVLSFLVAMDFVAFCCCAAFKLLPRVYATPLRV